MSSETDWNFQLGLRSLLLPLKQWAELDWEWGLVVPSIRLESDAALPPGDIHLLPTFVLAGMRLLPCLSNIAAQ